MAFCFGKENTNFSQNYRMQVVTPTYFWYTKIYCEVSNLGGATNAYAIIDITYYRSFELNRNGIITIR